MMCTVDMAPGPPVALAVNKTFHGPGAGREHHGLPPMEHIIPFGVCI
jgi:hypothetical protein